MNSDTEQPSDWCERLYEAKASGLLLYGRALGLSHSEAEDVLQETFQALLARPQAPAQPEYFCVRSYRNQALNYRRGLWRRVRREWESRRWFEQEKQETDREQQAMRCLQSLPWEQREAIVLKIWHQHTFKEIGDLLNLSPHTIAGRYRYGLEKIRVALQGTQYELTESVGEPVAPMDAPAPIAPA